jgi:hypothetical protein
MDGAGNVRISDDRYSRDLRRLQLAWRLLQLDARTATVRRWTNLSMYRVRALYRTYARSGKCKPRLHGSSPRTIGFFWRSARLRSEAAVLAGFFRIFGALPGYTATDASDWAPSLGAGELLCRALEQFQALVPDSPITIEYAILLWSLLIRGAEVSIACCERCHVLILIDRLAVGRRLCGFCLHEQQNGLAYTVGNATAPVQSQAATTLHGGEEAWQGSLF